MTFGPFESSRSLGEPVNLYLFDYGDQPTDFIAYTDAEEPIVHAGVTYQPVPIDRGRINSSGTLDKSSLTINVAAQSRIADLYLIYPPSGVTTIIVRQGHVGDPDDQFLVVWTGRVMSCSRQGSQATLTCEPVTTSMRRNGLRRRWQYGCPHALYGPECKASKAAATTEVTVLSISGNSVALSPGWSSRPEKHLGGIFEWQRDDLSTEMRTIRRVSNGGTVLLLSGPPRGLRPGKLAKAILGCNHKSGVGPQPDGDCLPLHNNVLNFGGAPYIPFKNPIGMVNNYY